MEEERSRKIAILIDAENISSKYAKLALDEAARLGTVICKRIYADWSSSVSASWRKAVMDYSIQPIQQFSNTTGKNSSDSAMIIDAMDLLHAGKLQGFCIVSSDSDFTRLAARLRESEMMVIGMGEKKTPTSFISACDKFLYLDVLLSEKLQKEPVALTAAKPKPTKKATAAKSETVAVAAEPSDAPVKSGMDKDEITKAIAELIDENSDEDGWFFMGALGSQLLSKYPDFDARNFGFPKLTLFVKSLDTYEFRSDTNPSNPHLHLVYVRKKRENATQPATE